MNQASAAGGAPDAPTAERYVKDGYLWNSGNFMFRADVLLAEYSAFNPASAETVARAVKNATDDLGFHLLDEAAFASAEKKSVDYAVMEKTRHAAVVPASYGWSDVGGWTRSGHSCRRTPTAMPPTAKSFSLTPAAAMC